MLTNFVTDLTDEGFKVDSKHATKDKIGSYCLPFSFNKVKFKIYFNSQGEVWQFELKKEKVVSNLLEEKYSKIEPLFLKNINAKTLKKYI